MNDVLIHSKRGITTIIGTSEKGKKWLLDNIILDKYYAVSIQQEHLEDFIDKLKEAELEYEEV